MRKRNVDGLHNDKYFGGNSNERPHHTQNTTYRSLGKYFLSMFSLFFKSCTVTYVLLNYTNIIIKAIFEVTHPPTRLSSIPTNNPLDYVH